MKRWLLFLLMALLLLLLLLWTLLVAGWILQCVTGQQLWMPYKEHSRCRCA